MTGDDGHVTDEVSLTRTGIMHLLIGALVNPVGAFDVRSAHEMARLILLTHAWCIREESAVRLRLVFASGKPLDDNALANMKTIAQEERVEHSMKLQEYAKFLLYADGLPQPKSMN